MSMSMTGLKTRSLTAIAAVLGALALMVVCVAPANAVTITSATPTTGLASSDTVTVKLSFSAGEAFYALAQCNADLAAGLACNSASAIGLIAVGSFPAGGEKVPVNKTFTNSSLIPGVPPIAGTTTCKGTSKTNANCKIFASTYDANGKQVGGASVAISFK